MKQIVLANSYTVLVDDEDYLLVKALPWQWSGPKKPKSPPLGGGFATWLSLPRILLLQPLIEALIKDPLARVEHINGDVLDNRRSNLRIVSSGEMQRTRWRIRAERHLQEGMKCSHPDCDKKATHLAPDDRWKRRRYWYACSIHKDGFDIDVSRLVKCRFRG